MDMWKEETVHIMVGGVQRQDQCQGPEPQHTCHDLIPPSKDTTAFLPRDSAAT